MNKILLIMPSFMDYEQILYDQLKKNYQVTLLNSDEYDQKVIESYRNYPALHKAIRKLSKRINLRDKETAQQKYDRLIMESLSDQKDYYQVILCINGGYTSEWLLETVRERNPNSKFIFYAWDDIDNLFSKCHVHLFDSFYSYNIDDCQKNHWVYLPMFVQEQYIGHKPENKYDICFIGTAHSDRVEIADKLLNLYAKKYNLFIYLYDKNHDTKRDYCYDKPLSYREYLEILRETKAVIDLAAETQTGPTTRVFDALLTDTKVITTNTHIVAYPVYSKNILIIDRTSLEIDDDFLKSAYQNIEYDALTPERWLKQLGL